jgi:hypothetical protein
MRLQWNSFDSVLAAVQQDDWALEHADDSLKSKIVLAANIDMDALRYAIQHAE